MKITSSNADPTLLRMSAPLMVSFIMRAAFTFVDTAYAATIGDSAVAAIGLTVPIEFLMISIWVGLSTGLTSALSRSMPAHEGGKIQQYLQASWQLVWLISPVFLLIGLGIGFVVPQFGLDDDVFWNFRVYAGVLIGASAFTAFWSIIPDSIVKAHQDTKSTMWAGIVSNLLNLALNTIFLFVFHWGIFGIAFSTVLGRIGGLVYALARARAHEAKREAAGLDTREGSDPTAYRTILSLAIPASLTFTLMGAELALINGLLATMGSATEAIAAFSIYHRVVLFAFNPIIAISVAMLPYAGRLVGRQDYLELRRGIREGLVVSVLYSLLLVGPVVILVGPWLSDALTESAITAQYTRFALYLVPVACAIGAPFLLSRPIFDAMGRGQPGLLVAVIRVAVLTAPAALVGMRIAEGMSLPKLYGLLISLQGVGALASMILYLWVRRALSKSQRGRPSAAVGVEEESTVAAAVLEDAGTR